MECTQQVRFALVKVLLVSTLSHILSKVEYSEMILMHNMNTSAPLEKLLWHWKCPREERGCAKKALYMEGGPSSPKPIQHQTKNKTPGLLATDIHIQVQIILTINLSEYGFIGFIRTYSKRFMVKII